MKIGTLIQFSDLGDTTSSFNPDLIPKDAVQIGPGVWEDATGRANYYTQECSVTDFKSIVRGMSDSTRVLLGRIPPDATYLGDRTWQDASTGVTIYQDY